MSEVNIGIAVKASKRLESKLSECFYANGKGLHEKISSVESILPGALVKKMRYVASIRNKVVHEDNYHINDIEKFIATANEALAELESMTLTKGLAKQPNTNFLPQKLWGLVIFIGVLLIKCS